MLSVTVALVKSTHATILLRREMVFYMKKYWQCDRQLAKNNTNPVNITRGNTNYAYPYGRQTYLGLFFLRWQCYHVIFIIQKWFKSAVFTRVPDKWIHRENMIYLHTPDVINFLPYLKCNII